MRRCNEIRHASDVFRHVDNATFVDTANDQLVAYVKGRALDAMIICVNLDPQDFAEGLVVLPSGVDLPDTFGVVDLLSGDTHAWYLGGNYVRLPPGGAHVLALR